MFGASGGEKMFQAENHLQSLGGKTEHSELGGNRFGSWEGPETSFEATSINQR